MNLPVLLILFRLCLAPIILVLAWQFGTQASLPIVILMYLGLLSDIFDGIIARKQKLSTAKLRRMDNQTDMLFWMSIGIATWLLHPDLLRPFSPAIWAVLGMEAACYATSLLKFKKETCTHAFLSKLWGLSLLAAFNSLIGFAHAGFPVKLAIAIGVISHIDRILITLILPRWAHDIPSAYHAWLLRQGKYFKRNPLLNG